MWKRLQGTPAEHLADIQAVLKYARSHGIKVNLYLEDWSNGVQSSPSMSFS